MYGLTTWGRKIAKMSLVSTIWIWFRIYRKNCKGKIIDPSTVGDFPFYTLNEDAVYNYIYYNSQGINLLHS